MYNQQIGLLEKPLPYVIIENFDKAFFATITTYHMKDSHPITHAIAEYTQKDAKIGQLWADMFPGLSMNGIDYFSLSMPYLEQLAMVEQQFQPGMAEGFFPTGYRVPLLSYAANKEVLQKRESTRCFYMLSNASLVENAFAVHQLKHHFVGQESTLQGVIGYLFASESNEQLSAVKKTVINIVKEHPQNTIVTLNQIGYVHEVLVDLNMRIRSKLDQVV